MSIMNNRFKTIPSKFKWHFSIIGILIVVGLVYVSSLPEDIGIPGVSATFGTPTYSDTRISSVNIYGNSSANIFSWGYNVNPDATPDLPINTWVEMFQVQIAVKVSRLATGGTYLDHIAVSGGITSPSGVTTPLSEAEGESEGYALGVADGIYYHVFQWNDKNYVLDEVGIYRLYFNLAIEVP